MPKRVDHEQRRRHIAAAVRRIAAQRGLEAVSLGEVATEAGFSKGLVQHYFPSKDAMLRYVTGTLREPVEDRVAPSFASGLPGLRAAAVALLPRDEASRTEALVANAFLMRALKDPEIAERFCDGHAQLRDGLAAMVTAAQSAGDLSVALDPMAEADVLVALVSGLNDAVLLGYTSLSQAEALIDHHLGRLKP